MSLPTEGSDRDVYRRARNQDSDERKKKGKDGNNSSQ